MLSAKTLCEDVSKAVRELRSYLRSPAENFEILTRFWALQDHLSRLVQSVADHREETLEVLSEEYPTLLRDVIDVISFIPRLRTLSCIDGVSAACADINESLLELEYLKHSQPAAVLTATA